MTCLVLTGVVEIGTYAFRLTFTDEVTGTTAVTQCDVRGNAPGSDRFAQVVDPATGTLRAPVPSDADTEAVAVSTSAFEVARAAQGGAIPPTTPEPIRAVAEATARERLRQGIARALATTTGGAA